MNLHIESTSKTCYYLDKNEENAFRIVINALNILRDKNIFIDGNNCFLDSNEFIILSEELKEILNGHGVESEKTENNDFSCLTYEEKPNARILFDKEEEEDEEEWFTEMGV